MQEKAANATNVSEGDLAAGPISAFVSNNADVVGSTYRHGSRPGKRTGRCWAALLRAMVAIKTPYALFN